VSRSVSVKRPLVVIGFIVLIVILAGCCCVCLWLSAGMKSGPYPPPPFPIEDLLLDESLFPEGWYADEPFDPEERLLARQVAVGLHRGECPYYGLGALHEVYRFSEGAKSATGAYPREIAYWFACEEVRGGGPWRIPTELPYQSPVADQFRFECCTYERTGSITCRAAGLYGRYIILFSVDLEPDYPVCMDFTDVERLLVTIDERMAFYGQQETD